MTIPQIEKEIESSRGDHNALEKRISELEENINELRDQLGVCRMPQVLEAVNTISRRP